MCLIFNCMPDYKNPININHHINSFIKAPPVIWHASAVIYNVIWRTCCSCFYWFRLSHMYQSLFAIKGWGIICCRYTTITRLLAQMTSGPNHKHAPVVPQETSASSSWQTQTGSNMQIYIIAIIKKSNTLTNIYIREI